MEYPTSTHLLWIATLSNSHMSRRLLSEMLLLLLSIVRLLHLLSIAEVELEDLESW